MKKVYSCVSVLLLILLLCVGCGSGNTSETEADASYAGVQELTLNEKASGTISENGEVDWYHFQAVEANNILQVNCSGNTYRPDVDLLVTVYQLDNTGKKVRLYADHAPEGSQLPADIKMNIYIDTPKDIYISVRDLLDDESSDNPYYLSIGYLDYSEGNDNFSQATPIVIDNPDTCQIDSIGYTGDVDCYKFEVLQAGVYAIPIDFTPFPDGTDVELTVDLYNSDGILIESISRGQRENYHMIPYLTPGEYYVLIDDYGKDDFDKASTFQICVESVGAGEIYENDSKENASPMVYDSAQTYTISGSLDYSGDKDWYRFPLQDIAEGFRVLNINFDDTNDVTYQINIEDSGGDTLLSHNYLGGSSAAYQTQIRAGEGEHYLLIQTSRGEIFSQQAPYTVSIQVLNVVDPAEDGEGNNTINTAQALSGEIGEIEGKIGFRGDEDWYKVEINTATTKVLEIFLNTDSPSNVEYYLSLMRDNVIRRLIDSNGQDGPTKLKTSILVPATATPTTITYFIRVCDYQGDNGDAQIPYKISANVLEIPESLPYSGPVIYYYYSEATEITDETAATIELEHNSLIQKKYVVNTTLLNYNTANPENGITKIKNGDLTTISFPWIGGYIDFQGDQDWFQIDLGPLFEEGSEPDSEWYYDIKIALHVGIPGSHVEYVWKFYRDRNQNQILVDRPGDSNGFFASAGDSDTNIQRIHITIPTEGTDQEFWVGDAWKGKFYLSISDFNYIDSEDPDDDWGYDQPYYYKITLIYHPGVSNPE